MNKKFSTLLVSALLASGAAFTAQAADYKPTTDGGTVKVGANAFLQAGAQYLGLENGSLVLISNPTADIAELQKAIWTIEKVEYSSPSGQKTYGYKFLHNQSGQYLSINLKTNDRTGGKFTKAGLKIESGNDVWAWNTTNGIYAAKGDSVFVIDGTGLEAVKGTTPATPSTAVITYGDINPTASTSSMTLTAADFNLLTKGSLYFNGYDVAGGQKNVLTENKWVAEDVAINWNIVTSFFSLDSIKAGASNQYLVFNNGTTVAGYGNDLKEAKKKNYLLVDNAYYDGPTDELPVLGVDTLSYDPVIPQTYWRNADGTKLDDATTGADGLTDFGRAQKAVSMDAINPRLRKDVIHHPLAAAFKAEYNIATDVITLTSAFQPQRIAPKTTLDSLTFHVKNDATVYAGAIKTLIDDIATFIGTPATDKAYESADNKEMREAAKAAIDKLTGDDKKEAKAKADAFYAGIAGLKWNSDGDLVSTKYAAPTFVDGVTALQVAKADQSISIVKLAGVQVVTVNATSATTSETDRYLDPKIQPYKTKPAAGGDADIKEGIYYIKNMNTVASGKANQNYGLYYDQSPVNATAGYVKEAQAFNPYAQYVVAAAPAAAKGNYVFTVLASNSVWKNGIVMKAGDNYVINGDTIALEAAGKLADVDKYIGSANFTAAELKNNTFAIASASAVLKGETFAMLADSAITLSADEVAFKLIAGSEVDKQGYDEKLAYVPYAIMTEDSLVITRTADDKYLFTTYKEAERVNKPVYFRLLATGSESTYVLYDVTKDDEAKVGINVQDKTVIVAAEEALNDLFTVTAVEAPASYKTIGETAKIQVANGNLAINNDNQAVSVREGDLRAAYTADDFVFTLDTAKYEGAETYTYFITMEVADTKLIMWEATDSAMVEIAAPYHSGLDTRILFRPLNKIEDDTLYVANLADLAKEDTVKNSTSYQFSFAQVSDDAADGYIMQSGDKYVAVANGVVVVTTDKENAATVQIETVEGPTANEAVAAAEVSVVGAQGAIIVKGAAGKVVTVANILGQTIANQVAVSDNVTIAAPAGVAIVTVDGEATKVVVK